MATHKAWRLRVPRRPARGAGGRRPAQSLSKIIVTRFELADFKRAVEAAALMQGLDLTAVVP